MDDPTSKHGTLTVLALSMSRVPASWFTVHDFLRRLARLTFLYV
jgi:hypothetical protein